MAEVCVWTAEHGAARSSGPGNASSPPTDRRSDGNIACAGQSRAGPGRAGPGRDEDEWPPPVFKGVAAGAMGRCE